MEELFNDFYKQLEEYDEKNPQPTQEFKYSDEYTLFMSSEKFLKHIWNVCRTQSDDIIVATLTFNYDRVFSIYEEGSEKDKESVSELFAYPKFLIGLARALYEKSPVSDTDIKRISRLYIAAIQVYQELTNIYPLYFALAKVVNARLVLLLKEILPEESAVLVAASANVAYESSICVAYVNYALACIDKQTPLTEQNIARIYTILSDNNFDTLRTYFVYTINDQCPNSELYFDNNFIASINIKLKNAICSIVENLSTYQIGLIVNAAFMAPNSFCFYNPVNNNIGGACDNDNMFGGKDTRNNIINNFPRIAAVFDYIKSNSYLKW